MTKHTLLMAVEDVLWWWDWDHFPEDHTLNHKMRALAAAFKEGLDV